MDLNHLIRQAYSGDRSAEDKLFEYLTVRFRLFVLLRLGSKMEVNDIVQETLMTISKKYKNTDLGAGFLPWAYGILKNNIRNYFRSKKYDRDKIDRFSHEDHQSAQINVDPELKIRLINCLRLICRLNIRYARVLNYHHLGYSAAEICAIMKTTTNHMYVIFSRAKSMLRDCLNKGHKL